MKLVFELEEVEKLLEVSQGEVQRYEDMAKANPDGNTFGMLLLKAKYEGRVKTFEEMLKFGERSE
jgi:hypothetical protein